MNMMMEKEEVFRWQQSSNGETVEFEAVRAGPGWHTTVSIGGAVISADSIPPPEGASRVEGLEAEKVRKRVERYPIGMRYRYGYAR
jgi:hypothetical protein